MALDRVGDAAILTRELRKHRPAAAHAGSPVFRTPSPDGDGIVCGDCAEPEEIRAWMAQAEQVENLDPLGLRDDDE